MTKVLLAHNPFDVKTEILVDQRPISDTSLLYKYLSSPMQDWVSDFFPVLIEHCNDDELDITFKGLQFNYDDLEDELGNYLKQNREYDIDLHFDGCKSQMARLGAIQSLMDEMRTQSIVPELNTPELIPAIAEAQKDTLQVIVVGGADAQRHRFVNELIESDIERPGNEVGYCFADDDSVSAIKKSAIEDSFQLYTANIQFVSSKFCHMEIYEIPDLETCKNAYYRFAKKTITADEKPIVVYIVDSDARRNSEEFLNMVSDQYKIRGKQNKRRFIFVAEDTSKAKRILSSEYAIKNAMVYTADEMKLIQHRIEEYQNEVCLVHQVKARCTLIADYLSNQEMQMSAKAEQDKKVSEIDDLEKQIITLLHGCKLIYQCEYQDQEVQDAHITAFFYRLGNEYKKKLTERSTTTGTSATWISILATPSQEARWSAHEFFDSLSIKFTEQMAAEWAVARIVSSVTIPRQLETLLGKIGCEAGLNQVEAFTSTTSGVMPSIEPYMKQIESISVNITHYKKGLLYLMCVNQGAVSGVLDDRVQRKDNDDGSYTDTYQYYDGIKKICCGNLYGDDPLDKEKIEKSVSAFRSELEKVRPILKAYFGACITSAKTTTQMNETSLNHLLVDVEQQIKHETQRLREAAEISEVEKRKIAYIRELRCKFEQLICL